MQTANYVILTFFICRYELTDERMLSLFRLLNATTRVDNQKLLFIFPFLRFLIPKQTGWEAQKQVRPLYKIKQGNNIPHSLKQHFQSSCVFLYKI